MTGKRAGLGRGLESLIPVGSGEPSGFASLPVADLDANPRQPRARFDDEALESLAASIREVGVLQPIAVTPGADGRYTVIAGERRLRAARRAGLAEIPAVIRSVDDAGNLIEAIIENVQREDLSPLEEAAGYQQLMEDFGMTHEDVGHRVGKSRAAVTNALRLLSLPPGVQGLLERGEIASGHARALAGLEDRKFAEHIASRAAEEGWSVRQIEEAVRVRRGDAPAGKARVTEVRPVEIIELEHRLTDQLGTDVRIGYGRARGGTIKGKVEIGFTSLDDLERLYRRFFA